MSKPPATPPSSDIDGADADARAGRPSTRPDPDDTRRLERGNEEARGRPPSDSGSEAIGD
ncbi:hypothetical protein ABC347_15715 [Sphingomonas sp. 1P06PA]|uniref:hypothetical protein n=1 Tax=Sphingomonas sp. 1P06PA TaxID=554121 RepID=UPI0039A5AD00